MERVTVVLIFSQYARSDLLLIGMTVVGEYIDRAGGTEGQSETFFL